ncbi:MAG: isochorismate synthase, partial [Dehalococcoidia bacterium]|nr:isochorismate synthase [Dehalococcoidia bacterium]
TLMGADDDHAARAAELAGGLDALVRGAIAPDADDDDAAAVFTSEDSAPDRPRWLEVVGAAVEDIRAGAAEKVVLARAVRSQGSRPLSVIAALRRLRERYVDSTTVFAIGQGDATFMGATPERLVKVEGRLVETASVAGTVARGGSVAEDAALGRSLLGDEKERHEHAVVVRALRESLTPLCADLDVPKAPVLLRNPALQHLYTPLRGRLREDWGVLDLVARLHPTPAVGGTPRAAAMERIGRYEGFDRGWYAGPVGWVDRERGGQFVVAIRSALVTGWEARLYAGCGIVADSQPEREYEESELKLRPMRWALTGQ